jgi:asparagine synthase (glutamine-hydrolysing)
VCGIAGFVGDWDQELLERMNAAIAHRGPDDAGVFWEPRAEIGLAHRRLSIIDLSPRGHQPMWDATETAVIVYNGELYNYRELRKGLLADGFQFNSDSDTEVLLNLYLRDGEEMLSELNGIFSFAIWDTRSESLLVVRDGLGVKPLYYTETPSGFLFASEMKALLQAPEVDRSLDPRAIHQHLVYLWCPSPHTVLKNVQKLPPGYALVVKDRKVVRRWRHYDVPYEGEIEDMDEQDAIEAVRQSIETAVERQMVADVPVGSFLSGGLDSSAVVHFARQFAKDGALECFTIGFRDDLSRQEGMTEDLPYARQVAEHLGVNLHTIWVGPEMIEELPTMLYHLDEPQADLAPINALFISRLAREHGVKVLLSGAGGDDIFSGYRRHYALLQERYWRWLPRSARSALRRFASGVSNPQGGASRRFAKAFAYADMEGTDRLASYFYWISPERMKPLYAREVFEELRANRSMDALNASLYSLPEGVPELNKMLYLETKFFLADHNLNYTDKMSMASGVEVRVPLLDPDLVGLAARLPLKYKMRGTTTKWILRKAVEGALPRNVLQRPKTGFGAPLRPWLRGELRPIVDDVLSAETLRKRGLFQPEAVTELVEADRAGRVDASYTLFSLMCLELWCRMFVDETRPTLRAI